MKYILLVAAVWLSASGSAQQWTKLYDNFDDCTCGLAKVTKGDKVGFVSKDGKLIVPLIDDDALHFKEGMGAVKKDGKWGYLDSTGREVITFQFTDASSF